MCLYLSTLAEHHFSNSKFSIGELAAVLRDRISNLRAGGSENAEQIYCDGDFCKRSQVFDAKIGIRR